MATTSTSTAVAVAESVFTGYRAFLAASSFGELTRTERGWTRAPHQQ